MALLTTHCGHPIAQSCISPATLTNKLYAYQLSWYMPTGFGGKLGSCPECWCLHRPVSPLCEQVVAIAVLASKPSVLWSSQDRHQLLSAHTWLRQLMRSSIIYKQRINACRHAAPGTASLILVSHMPVNKKVYTGDYNTKISRYYASYTISYSLSGLRWSIRRFSQLYLHDRCLPRLRFAK